MKVIAAYITLEQESSLVAKTKTNLDSISFVIINKNLFSLINKIMHLGKSFLKDYLIWFKSVVDSNLKNNECFSFFYVPFFCLSIFL